MGVNIITDSAVDLPREVAEEYDIDVIPFEVIKGDEVYQDGVNLAPVDLFEQMREGAEFKTSQVKLSGFKTYFKKYAEKNSPSIYIGFSSELSGAYQASVLAKDQVMEEFPNFKLEVIDTKCASLGFGLVVYKAAQLAADGKSFEEIIEKVKFYSEHMEHVFTVDDLEYLKRGGRVSKAKAFVAGVLNIQPILHVDEGRLIPIEKRKGRKRVFKRMLEIMDERGENIKDQLIAISHGDDLESAEELKEMIKEKYGCKEFMINMIGSTVGAHAGPGTIALFFLNKVE